eukprot:scaffold5088_cov98-Cylindrotheca_fusiformis.AAC.11
MMPPDSAMLFFKIHLLLRLHRLEDSDVVQTVGWSRSAHAKAHLSIIAHAGRYSPTHKAFNFCNISLISHNNNKQQQHKDKQQFREKAN